MNNLEKRRIASILSGMLFMCSLTAYSQSNTFPSTGNVGIGTTSPKGLLHVSSERDYFVNRTIPGYTEDSQGVNYILLHKAYNGILLEDHHVIGKITGTRGDPGAWNRKLTIEVNTASAYNTDRGSLMCYNEPTRLVTLTYRGVKYLAVEIRHHSTLHSFSFTGYAFNETFQLTYDQDVSNVEAFQSLDPITIQGSLALDTYDTYGYKLAVNGNIRAKEIKVEAGNWPDYVFTPENKRPTLSELEDFVQTNRHLPGIPSASEVKDNGVNLGEMNTALLKKVEELTLYIIEQNKKLEGVIQQNEKQQEKLRKLEELVSNK
ncbi:hypothetical protein [Pararcticibacter amylolyticus]|uniref:Cell wall anchor protein n=1 Tax=Pararcticibacter amylolyticus TaxID=2173175 RepID=A0A2U2P9L7_9SPHI|nr:hypothetical protein [Pararcticibacter amylolyticus]PWG78035.1 hypothetical protein DDR33_24305 [Pararcticibacter amylolyticus]